MYDICGTISFSNVMITLNNKKKNMKNMCSLHSCCSTLALSLSLSLSLYLHTHTHSPIYIVIVMATIKLCVLLKNQVHQAKLLRRKGEAGEKYIRKAHPMRKSLAEAGTSFETGVRRSKRIKMGPLGYWKGERFLYGRVDNSLKLLGVKYISSGKGDENLEVKSYIMVETSEYKELLELAARH